MRRGIVPTKKLVFLSLIFCAVAFGSNEAQAGTCDTDPDASRQDIFTEGTGLSADPYIICNVYQLQLVNNDLTAFYELGNDIDASDTLTQKTVGGNVFNPNGFIPIGTCGGLSCRRFGGSPFTGSFNGNGFAISGLHMDHPVIRGIGLFGFIDTGAVLTDFTLESVDINGSRIVAGGGAMGAVCGYVWDSTYSSGVSVTDITVSSGNLYGNIQKIGGAIGMINYSYGYFNNIHSNATVQGIHPYAPFGSGGQIVGGVIGALYGTVVSQLSSKGTLSSGFKGNFGGIGGVIGFGYKMYSGSDLYFDGTISGSNHFIGGIVGIASNATLFRTFTGDSASLTATLPAAYYNSYVGGIVGNIYNGSKIYDSFSVGSLLGLNATNYVGGVIGHDGYGGGYVLANNYWLDGGGNPSGCHGVNGNFAGCVDASGLTPPNNTLTGFYSESHPVYSRAGKEWDFTNVWESHVDALPTFRALAPPLADSDGDLVADADDLCPGTTLATPPGSNVDAFGCDASDPSQCPSGEASCADYAIIGYDENEGIINTSGDVIGNTASVDSTTEGTPDTQTTTFTIPPQDDGFGPTEIFIEDSGSTSGTGFVGAFTAVGLTNAIIIGPAGTSFSPPATICITFADFGFCCDLSPADGFDDSFVIGKDGDDPGTIVGDNVPPDVVLDTTCVDNFLTGVDGEGNGINPCLQLVDPSLSFGEIRLCAEISSLSTFYAGRKNANITGNNEVDEACHVVPGALVYANAETGKSNHGAYVSCVANAVFELRKAGELSKSDGAALIKTAAKSGVNK